MRSTLILLLCITLSLVVSLVHGVSFHLENNRKHCFLEDLHVNSHVLISYSTPKLSHQPVSDLSGTTLVIRDPFGNILKAEELSSTEGNVQFKSLTDVSGLYEFCFRRSTSWLSKGSAPTMLNVKIEADDDAQEYQKIESRDRLEKLSGLLEKLSDKVRFISDDQSYMKLREKRFRYTTEFLHSRIYWIAFLQAITFTAVGFWQSYSLKNFFKSKKLV